MLMNKHNAYLEVHARSDGWYFRIPLMQTLEALEYIESTICIHDMGRT